VHGSQTDHGLAKSNDSVSLSTLRSGCGGEVVLEGGRRRGQQCGLTSGGEHRERWTATGSGGAACRAGSETGELCG
jgi:hypothetical protein